MSAVYYQLWCEWDCGFSYKLFTSEEAALAYAAEVLPDMGVEETVGELIDAGLLGTEELVVIS